MPGGEKTRVIEAPSGEQDFIEHNLQLNMISMIVKPTKPIFKDTIVTIDVPKAIHIAILSQAGNV